MKKFVTLLAVLLVSFMSTPAFTSSDSIPVPNKDLHEKCLYPTVKIIGSESNSNGSGVIVRSDRIATGVYHNVVITCDHVVRSRERFFVEKSDYKDWSSLTGVKRYDSYVYNTNFKEDLAIIVFTSKVKMPTAELDFKSKFYIGSKVLRFGHGLGEEARLDRGEITSKSMRSTGLKNLVRTSIPTVPGDSGSGIFHNYKVIAITKAIKSIPGGFANYPVYHMSYGVSIQNLKVWDNEINHRIDFSYDKDKRMPVIPFFYLKIMSAELNKSIVPLTIWD